MLIVVIQRLRRDESGFSITELLTAMVIGSVVLWALMTLMTTGFSKSVEVTDRAEAAQSARSAMDRIVMLMDSTICLDPSAVDSAIPPLIGSSTSPAVTGSDGNYIAFYADLDGVSDQPDKYTITYDPTAKTLTERRYDGVGSLPNITFSTAVSQTRVLASQIVPVSPLPVFRYYSFKSDGTFDVNSPLSTPITQANAINVVRAVVSFRSVPTRTGKEDARSTALEEQSAIGTPDPMTPSAGSCP